MFEDNKILGQFNLEGIAPAPRGIPQIEISYDIDANGILKVTAIDKGTNKEMSTTINGSTKLDDSEIDRMVAEAESHKEADEKRKKLIEAKNSLESTIIGAKKILKEQEEVLKEHNDIVSKVESAIKEAEDVLANGKEVEELTSATEKLSNELMEIGKVVYEKQQSGNNGDQPVDPEVVG